MKLRKKLLMGIVTLALINIPGGIVKGANENIIEIEDGENIINGKRWFYKDGEILTGLQTHNEKTAFYLDGGGVAKEWKEIDGKQYYFLVNGSTIQGIHIIKDIPYGFNKDGSLAISEVTPEYVTDENGIAQLGWQSVEGNDYYFFNDGIKAIGIQEIDGVTYAFNEDSTLAKLKTTTEYVTDENGIVQLGWQTVGDNTYYFSSDLSKATGIQEIDGQQYGFNEDGSLARNQSIGIYQLDENGIVKLGWQIVDGKKYYFTDEGLINDGIHTINEVKYGFKDGTLVTNGHVGIYKTDIEGKITGKLPVDRENFQTHIIDKLDTFGWNENGVYEAIRYKYKYKNISSQGDTIDNAIYLINNGKTSCYGYAALAYHMWLAMGYDARYIVGTGRLGGEHAWIAVKLPEGWSYYDTMYMATPYTKSQLVNMGYKWNIEF
ncbi:hypothetical protein AN640_08720 [Candidatus Epulonipiscium fishelsonii]|uniref:Uncharacterized protein n=1 Tax=Candidatus Epulonipiscium fishelsonii TaxID=77094 RepID=A0ACC8XCY1_9FIRM|nr:hypothetical protein AN640_08720 [Epulopiscium sp. SCG-D08WGA-EpuloA1]